MTDENENDYRFFAEEEGGGTDEHTKHPDEVALRRRWKICEQSTEDKSVPGAEESKPEPSSKPALSNPEEISENPPEDIPTDHLADTDKRDTENSSTLPALTEQKTMSVETDLDAAFSVSVAYIKEPSHKKSHRFGAFLRRGIGLLCAAALFGGVAAGAFIGFNELYYYLNPSAKPSLANTQAPGNRTSNTQPLISHTFVASGTSVATSDVSDIVRNAMPSLVSISCTFRNTTSFFGYLYEGTSEGAGSGIIVGKNDKELLIATNNHVVNGAITITVTFLDGSQIPGSVRGTEEAADLAIVSVPLADISSETIEGITIATLGNSDDAKVGQMVIAIGNALGYGQTTTVGYLSAKEREITISDASTGKTTKYIALQVDAAINPGNSGGALINTEGKVIGINSAKLSNTKVEGIGYAIPINDAINILDELMNREILTEEEQGYLGVYLSDQEITEEISRLYGFPSGVFVSEAVKGGAADEAGILPGDIITKINGSPITARTQLQEKVKSYRCGTEIEVTLARLENGEYTERNVTVILGSKADFE